MANKISSKEAAALAGRILNGGRFSMHDVLKLAASVLAQRPQITASKKTKAKKAKRSRG